MSALDPADLVAALRKTHSLWVRTSRDPAWEYEDRKRQEEAMDIYIRRAEDELSRHLDRLAADPRAAVGGDFDEASTSRAEGVDHGH